MSEIKIALAGNPNSGKTTMFNSLTGSRQYVGNWPGVTVEKKEGKLKGHDNVIIQDLPGIYSLSPYTLEEVITRNYLVNQKPDAIINIIDATNIERNLYLTTQLLEVGVPIVIALNMMDLVKKNGDIINIEALSKALGCPVLLQSAINGDGVVQAAEAAIKAAKEKQVASLPSLYQGTLEHAIAHIEESIEDKVDKGFVRFFAIKLFERDELAYEELKVSDDLKEHIEKHIKECEAELDDDAESIIIAERYDYIGKLVGKVVKKSKKASLSISDKIDKLVTNRILALPIFAVIMFFVYYISISTIGDVVTTYMNDTLAATAVDYLHGIMDGAVNPVLTGLLVDGIVGGVGAVLGFVPQILILYIMLAFLEQCGYMARVAFIMDRIFRKFGLSGKSFIPMLISSGCAIPGIMATRTIENENDRRMTIMTTAFIPCGAKMPIVGLIAAACFNGGAWVATSAYFVGITAIVISGIILKKTKSFAGKPAPFVMELPAYHLPKVSGVLRSMWERGWSFIKRAGTVIVAASVFIWFLSSFGNDGNGFGLVDDMNNSILAGVGNVIRWIFVPLGFGNWQSAVATIMGLVAKEEVVGVFGTLSSVGADLAAELVDNYSSAGSVAGLTPIGILFFNGSGISAYSFMLFNLLCAPCFAAMGAIKREMNSAKWTWTAIGYMCGFAWVISLIFYQFASLIQGGSFNFFTVLAIVLFAALVYLLFFKKPAKVKSTVDELIKEVE